MKGQVRLKDDKRDQTFGNLMVDDCKELTLDFLGGLKSWWNPKDQTEYDGTDGQWDTTRYVLTGECMFHNSAKNTRNGTYGVPSGDEYDYPIATTWLVSPEDSFLSARVSGSSAIQPTVTRRDQTLELEGTFEVPGDIPSGSQVREFGFFLTDAEPDEDPSLLESEKPKSMLCRVAVYGSGYYDSEGNEVSADASGAKFCYTDDPWEADSDIEFYWKIGDL